MVVIDGKEFRTWEDPIKACVTEQAGAYSHWRIRSVFAGDRKVYPETGYKYRLAYTFSKNESFINGNETDYNEDRYRYTEQNLIEADFPICIIAQNAVFEQQIQGTEYLIIPPCGVTLTQRKQMNAWRDHSYHPYWDYTIKGRCRITRSSAGTYQRRRNGTTNTYSMNSAEKTLRMFGIKNVGGLRSECRSTFNSTLFILGSAQLSEMTDGSIDIAYFGVTNPSAGETYFSFNGTTSGAVLIPSAVNGTATQRDPVLQSYYTAGYNDSVTITANNNPTFATVEDYVRYILKNPENRYT